MKKILLGLLFIGALASCKKDKNNSSCGKSVDGIANTFKLTSYKVTTLGVEQDVLSSLTDCEKNATYQLKSDKSVAYTESGSGCTGTSSGSWDVVSEKLTITAGVIGLANATIDSWDCSTLNLSYSQSSGGLTITMKVTFTKQ